MYAKMGNAGEARFCAQQAQRLSLRSSSRLGAALVTVSMEEEQLSLVPLAVIYRFFFILFLFFVIITGNYRSVLCNFRNTWKNYNWRNS